MSGPAEVEPAGPPRRRLLRWGLSLLVLGILAHSIDLATIYETVTKVKLWPLVLACFGEWLFIAVESLRIRALFRRTFTWQAILRSRLLANFVGNFLPGLASADVLRIFVLDSWQPGRKFAIGIVLITNRLYGLIALLALFALLPLFAGELYYARLHLPTWSLYAMMGLALLTVLLCYLVPASRFVRMQVAVQLRKTRKARFLRPLQTAYLALLPTGQFRVWAFILSSSLFTTGIAVGQYCLLGYAVGLEESFAFWAMALTLASLGSMLPLGLGAVGPQDFTLLAIARYFGHPVEAFLVLSLLVHVMRLIGSLPGALLLGDLERMTGNWAQSKLVGRLFKRYSKTRLAGGKAR